MKILLYALFASVLLAVLIYLWGMSLPSIHQLNTEKTVNAPVAKVWSAMSDWEGQVKWRKSVKSVEILDEVTFIEHPQRGPAITFEVLSLQANKVIELKMSGAFEGYYKARFSEEEGVTRVVIEERIVQTSIMERIMTTLFFDLNAFVDDYFDQLNGYLDSLNSPR